MTLAELTMKQGNKREGNLAACAVRTRTKGNIRGTRKKPKCIINTQEGVVAMGVKMVVWEGPADPRHLLQRLR